VAGPVANFLLAIAVLAVFMATMASPQPGPVDAFPGGAAEAAGFKPGDLILKADGRKIETFQDLSGYVALRANCRSTSRSSAAADAPSDRHPARSRSRTRSTAA
jgi:membrane-associated protease RseP (regulator of RpoE activity)